MMIFPFMICKLKHSIYLHFRQILFEFGNGVVMILITQNFDIFSFLITA